MGNQKVRIKSRRGTVRDTDVSRSGCNKLTQALWRRLVGCVTTENAPNIKISITTFAQAVNLLRPPVSAHSQPVLFLSTQIDVILINACRTGPLTVPYGGSLLM